MKDKYLIWHIFLTVIGLWLVTACHEQTPVPTPTPTPAPTVSGLIIPVTGTASPVCQPAPPSGWGTYTVQRGDTLLNLATGRGVTVEQVRQINCLTSNALVADTTIYLPLLPTPTPCRVEVPIGWVAYQIQTGDTLFSLTTNRQTTVAEIEQVNCLAAGAIVAIGQTLYLPQLPTPTSTSTPLPPPPPPTPRPTPTFPLITPTPGIVSLAATPSTQILAVQGNSSNQSVGEQQQTDNVNQLTGNTSQTGDANQPTMSKSSETDGADIQLPKSLKRVDLSLGQVIQSGGTWGFDPYEICQPLLETQDSRLFLEEECDQLYFYEDLCDANEKPAVIYDKDFITVCLGLAFPINQPVTVNFFSEDRTLDLSGVFQLRPSDFDIRSAGKIDYRAIWRNPNSISGIVGGYGRTQVELITLSFGWPIDLPRGKWSLSVSEFTDKLDFAIPPLELSEPKISLILDPQRLLPTDDKYCYLLTPDEVKSPLKVRGINFPVGEKILISPYRSKIDDPNQDYQLIEENIQRVTIDDAGILSTTIQIDPTDIDNQYKVTAHTTAGTIESACFRIVTPQSVTSLPEEPAMAAQEIPSSSSLLARMPGVMVGPTKVAPTTLPTPATTAKASSGSSRFNLLLIFGLLVLAGLGGWLWVKYRWC